MRRSIKALLALALISSAILIIIYLAEIVRLIGLFYYPIIAFATNFGLFLTFYIYIRHRTTSLLELLSSTNQRICEMMVQNPEFTDYQKTRRYDEEWENNPNTLNKFEAFARMCWEFAETIYSTKVFPRQGLFIKRFAFVFERCKRRYGKWFENNSSSFSSPGFLEFVRHCKWRRYLDPRTADLLRWDNEYEDYDKYMIHPFQKEVKNPLVDYFKNEIKNKEKKVVADFGCGNGSFIKDYLAPHFKKVYGIDYSDNMLQATKKNCDEFIKEGKVEVLKLDMTKDLSKLYEKYEIDLGFSINSILPRNPTDTPKILEQIAKTLKSGGEFVAILPSFTALRYVRKLYWKKFLQEAKGNWLTKQVRTRLRLRREFDRKYQYNPRKKLFADNEADIQRFIDDDEIEPLFKKVGLKVKTLGKRSGGVVYPWDVCERTGYGHFTGEEELWDCFVRAEKEESKPDKKRAALFEIAGIFLLGIIAASCIILVLYSGNFWYLFGLLLFVLSIGATYSADKGVRAESNVRSYRGVLLPCIISGILLMISAAASIALILYFTPSSMSISFTIYSISITSLTIIATLIFIKGVHIVTKLTEQSRTKELKS